MFRKAGKIVPRSLNFSQSCMWLGSCHGSVKKHGNSWHIKIPTYVRPRVNTEQFEHYCQQTVRLQTLFHFSEVSLCAEAVSKIGYTMFGLQFYGECWSGENATESFDRDGKSNRCITMGNYEFKQCIDDSDEACTGVDRTNYVYRIIKSGTKHKLKEQ